MARERADCLGAGQKSPAAERRNSGDRLNVLITGARGLIGSALSRRLSGDHTVICQSRTAVADVVCDQWVKHDLVSDAWEALSLPRLDVVYHLAGQTSTYRARESPMEDLTSNVAAFVRLLEYLRRTGHGTFVVFAGAATAVGLTEDLPIRDDAPPRPVTFYDVSKVSAELYLMQYVREGWVKGCSLRLANVYGRAQAGQQRDRGILDKMFARALAGEDLTVYGDGGQLRDYVFIDDVVSALALAPKYPERTNGRIFNIGTGRGTSLKAAFSAVARAAAAATGNDVTVREIPFPPELSDIERRSAVIDSSAFTEATGWRPEYDFERGLAAALETAGSARGSMSAETSG